MAAKQLTPEQHYKQRGRGNTTIAAVLAGVVVLLLVVSYFFAKVN